MLSVDMGEMNEQMNICQVLTLSGTDGKRKDKNDPNYKVITVIPG